MNQTLPCNLSLVYRKVAVHFLTAIALIAVSLAASAEPGALQSSAPLSKHARHIERRLEKFRQGTVLDFEFRDSSQTFGSLGPLSATSFEFTDSDSNKMQTHSYDDLVDVKRAKEYIGDGSVHHHIHLLVPVIVGAGVAAGGIAAYEVLR
ncbi:MAG TPA: hypothetical protein VMT38_09355 [Terracidiphilus sp.]|nr:hypothetical protein [Terracidiphilus sp.]